MTIHCCRDLYLGGSRGYSSGSYDTMWAINAFLQGVLLYQFQSSGGNITPPAYSDFSVPYYTGSSVFGQVSSSLITIHSASAFMGNDVNGNYVQFSKDTVNMLSAAFPTGYSSSTPWPTGDVFNGKWLAVRSTLYPLANSGIFVVTSESLSQNKLYIDYRSSTAAYSETGSYNTVSIWTPPPGSDNATAGSGTPGGGRTGATWAAFNAFAGNGNTGHYQTTGSATQPRIILTSPDPSAYQVRLCLESVYDVQYGQGGGGYPGPNLTMMPGFSGSGGDFQPQSFSSPKGSTHLHASQWFDNRGYVANQNNVPGSAGTLVGHDYANVAGIGDFGSDYRTFHRFYAWGNDQTGACVVLTRGFPFIQGYQNATYDVMSIFGLPEDETLPLVADNINRLFVVGQNQVHVGVDWNCGSFTSEGYSGIAFSLDKKLGPISCMMAPYLFAAYQDTNALGIRFDAGAGDTPFLQATEVISVDLIAGTWPQLYGGSINYGHFLNLEPRRMGRVPIARLGRATGQTTWSTADTAKQWFHVSNGVYLPWGGLVGL